MQRRLMPLDDRGPMRVMFVITSMPVGGAETLLCELLRRMDRSRFLPELCCLKTLGPLGEKMAEHVPAFTGLLRHKYDVAILPRLVRLLRERRIDAVVTVGTGGDKMFWGRLAAWLAGVPVICSALHSTGLPDRVERLNRLLTPLTDAFIAVARPHAAYLAEHEGCPAARVRVVPNGVDTGRFRPRRPAPGMRSSLGLPSGAPIAGIVAALRPEKNHELFLQAAALVRKQVPDARFLIVGDGPRREALEQLARELLLDTAVRFLGSRSDVAELLPAMDVVVLSSHMEANPLAILEAMAAERPVVATRVGSIPDVVVDGRTGWLVDPGSAQQIAGRLIALFENPADALAMGRAGRKRAVNHGSIQRTVAGYEQLLAEIYSTKAAARARQCKPAATDAGAGASGQRAVGSGQCPDDK